MTDHESPDPLYTTSCARGDHDYVYRRSCAAYVCVHCDDHRGLALCYCGWPDGIGAEELIDCGEVIDDDEW